MKKPSVFVNKIDKKIQNNETVFSTVNREDRAFSSDSSDVKAKLKSIFSSPHYVYKANVRIKTKNGIENKQIVGMSGDKLLTLDNKFINIDDIENIEMDNSNLH